MHEPIVDAFIDLLDEYDAVVHRFYVEEIDIYIKKALDKRNEVRKALVTYVAELKKGLERD